MHDQANENELPPKFIADRLDFIALPAVVMAVAVAGCGGNSDMAAKAPPLPPEFAALGEPRRNIDGAHRPIETIASEAAARMNGSSGVIPVMHFPSKGFVVENVYNAVANEQSCETALKAYDADLHKQLGGKYDSEIRQGLYCIAVASGKPGKITVISSTF